jgi:hypothetical protein
MYWRHSPELQAEHSWALLKSGVGLTKGNTGDVPECRVETLRLYASAGWARPLSPEP